jgi:hypothetical protein
VGFDGCQVVIRSPAAEAVARLDRAFERMLVRDVTQIVGELEVRPRGAGYSLHGARETQVLDGSLSQVLHALHLEVVLRLVDARPDLLWLHAGVAAYRGSAVLIAGRSGRGKSTLVTRLCERGWTYFSDDLAPLDPKTGCVIPFPQTPMVRRGRGQEVPEDRLHEMKKWKVNLEAVGRAPAPVAALVFPAFQPHCAARLTPRPPATAALELLANALNLRARHEEGVDYLCGLVKRLPTYDLAFDDGARAADLLNRNHSNERAG